MNKRRSEKTRRGLSVLSFLDKNYKEPEYDKDNDLDFASRYGYDCAYPALLVSPKADEIDPRPTLMHVKQNGLWGLCDRKGKRLLPCEYEDIDYVRLTMAFEIVLVKKDGKWGCVWFYPKRESLPCIYDNMFVDQYRFPDSVAAIQDGKEGLISSITGQCTIPIEYDSLRPVGEYTRYPLLIAEKNGKYGLISSYDNKIYQPIIYDKIYRDHNQYYAVKGEETILLEKDHYPKLYKFLETD